ncbi:type I DNA topoisomerase [Candidatus Saccharibacteria bacterium]|nr:type I DNA topoisomerase [Candidatus Saccharibacteria bacterium]MBI3338297.1 type I DNA topoisomerase [Candidatus Saccharibacteria bacterium]
MTKNLVIVESPAKAKTIQKYLGKDFMVKSSFGHIRDLPKKGLNIDVENNFAPTYDILADKKKVVRELKTAAKDKEVWLASDEDREGEAIAWHLCSALGIKPEQTKRIVFHEITKTAIETAIKKPRTVDIKLVDAQQARRILDRLVGYELSPVLWKKVRPGLSAGRVQSVAVRLIVERERQIKNHASKSNYKITAQFIAGSLSAELSKRMDNLKEAEKFLEDCKIAIFKIASIDQKPGIRNPSAPFTTSTLQQEASRKLGFSVKQTMTLAQKLYESGNITYMRTDSTILSGQAIKAAEDFIQKEYGPKYHKIRQYKTKNSSAQEAHEAIRPTNFSQQSAGSDDQQKKLYALIWRRALASQMAAAELDRTDVIINISNRQETFEAKGEVLRFDGFLKVYGGGKDDVILPNLQSGQELTYDLIQATETFNKPPARYSEASLVRKLEELGIGRPSTYAPTISTIQARGYVERADLEGEQRKITVLDLRTTDQTIKSSQETQNFGADKGKLIPTPLADVTTDFLVKNFGGVIDYDFTATVERSFDEIAEGTIQWQGMIKKFYNDFHPLVKESENVSREESTQTRHLGNDPSSKKPIMARYGRYGPMLQRGETESEEKPDFAAMPDGATIEDVTLEQALEMFKLPRLVGQTKDGKDIKANIGRFGPYIVIDKLFISIKPHNPMKISLEEALELYDEKLQQEANKYIQRFTSGINIVNGPYGPYITDGKKNARLDKTIDPTKLTEAEAKTMLEKAPSKSKKRFVRRTKK